MVQGEIVATRTYRQCLVGFKNHTAWNTEEAGWEQSLHEAPEREIRGCIIVYTILGIIKLCMHKCLNCTEVRSKAAASRVVLISIIIVAKVFNECCMLYDC